MELTNNFLNEINKETGIRKIANNYSKSNEINLKPDTFVDLFLKWNDKNNYINFKSDDVFYHVRSVSLIFKMLMSSKNRYNNNRYYLNSLKKKFEKVKNKSKLNFHEESIFSNKNFREVSNSYFKIMN